MIETVCMDKSYVETAVLIVLLCGASIGVLVLLYAQAFYALNNEEVALKRRLIAENAELRERVKGGRK